jgi:Tfp pilus assembly protein FimT
LSEIMVVLTIIAGLTLFSLPKFAALQERSRLTAARQEIEAAIATARAAAVQKGRTATLSISGNTLLVTVTSSSSGTQTTIIPSMPFDTVYGVTLSATNPTITFDMRGFASPRLGGTGKFRLVGTSRRDSVCVTTVGQIMRRGCSL